MLAKFFGNGYNRSDVRFVNDLDDSIFPLLVNFSCYPYIDKDAVEALDE